MGFSDNGGNRHPRASQNSAETVFGSHLTKKLDREGGGGRHGTVFQACWLHFQNRKETGGVWTVLSPKMLRPNRVHVT